MMPLGSAEIEQIGTYVRANLAEWMEDIVGPRLLGARPAWRTSSRFSASSQLPLRGGGQAVRGDAPSVRHRRQALRGHARVSLVCDALESIPGSSSGWPTAIRASAATASPSIRGSSCTRRQRDAADAGESTYTSSAQAARRNSGSTRQSNPAMSERHQRPRVESDPANHRATKGGDSTCMASALRELRWCSSLGRPVAGVA